MKKNGWAFFSLSLVLISVSSAQAESDFLPSSLPAAGPTVRPGIAPSPAFHDFYDPPTVPTPTPVFSPAPIVISSPIPTPTPAIKASPAVVRPKLLPPITLSFFGGGDFISLNEVNNFVGTQLFKSAIYYGGEIRYPFSNNFSFLLRVERLAQSSSVGAAAFSLNSIPVMAGLDYHFSHPRKIRFHFSALVGPALGTNLTETAVSLPSPNMTEYSSTAISGMLRLSLEYPISRRIGIFTEVGYRLLDTSSATPTQTGSGGTIFQSNGQYQALPLNLSGPFIGGGFVFVL